MPRTKYSSYSPYNVTAQTSWYLDLYVNREIPALDTDRLLTVDRKYHRKPYLLSFDLYGTSRLWWVFAVRNPNDIKDPIYDLVEGLQIYVPERDSLLSLLNVQ